VPAISITQTAANDLTQSLWGEGKLASSMLSAETAPVTASSRSGSNASEILTAPGESAFRIAVIKSNEEALMLFKGISDQQADITAARPFIHFIVPADSFAHTNPKAVIYLSARMSNGENLPAWLVFNPNTGTFEGEPPEGERGDIQIMVIARDNAGREAIATFRIRVETVAKKVGSASRPSFSELIQMRQVESRAPVASKHLLESRA
jgi:predicted Fe-Mo cluster-binding NifX family protein